MPITLRYFLPAQDHFPRRQRVGLMDDAISNILDDPDFRNISRAMVRFNIFEAVGVVRSEIRHSNFLSYLLSPARSHGFGDRFLAAFLRSALARVPAAQRPINSLELAVADLDGAVVHREWRSIDILIVVDNSDLVVLIENKIDAGLGKNQLVRYKNTVESEFPGKRHIFILLSPDEMEPDEPSYISMGYSQLTRVLEGAVVEDASVGSLESRAVVEHYISMLRRHIVPDEKLIELARKVYEKHKEAFDFIFDSRPNAYDSIAVMKSVLENRGGIIRLPDGANILRFIPGAWKENKLVNSGYGSEWTRTGHALLFELKCGTGSRYQDRITISLVVGPADSALRERIYAHALELSGLYRGLVKPMGTRWSTIFLKELLSAPTAAQLSFEEKSERIRAEFESFMLTDFVAISRDVSGISIN